MGLIGLIAIITLMRVLLWFSGINHRRRDRHGSIDLNPPLVQDDQLQSMYLKNDLDSSSYNDDVKSLQP